MINWFTIYSSRYEFLGKQWLAGYVMCIYKIVSDDADADHVDFDGNDEVNIIL